MNLLALLILLMVAPGAAVFANAKWRLKMPFTSSAAVAFALYKAVCSSAAAAFRAAWKGAAPFLGLLLCLFAAPSAQGDTAIKNLLLQGSGSHLQASSTFTLDSTATFTAASGSAVNLSAGTVTYPVGQLTDTGASLANKPSLRAVAVANVSSMSGTTTLDGISCAVGDVVLLTAQTTGAQNGPWVIASGSWTRPTWFPTGGTMQAFRPVIFFVRNGTGYGSSNWSITTTGTITIDTTSIALSQHTFTLSSTSVTGTLPIAQLPSLLTSVTDGNASLARKPPVKAVSVANVASLSGTTTIDGVSLAAGDPVLLTAQTTASQNGPWLVQASTWTRPGWYTAASTTQAFWGVSMRSTGGTNYNGSDWYISTTAAITIGTTSVTFGQFGNPASGVTAATYGDTTHVPQITVNAAGLITSASNVAVSGGGGGATGFIRAYDSKTSGTGGGSSVATTWTTRVLTTLVDDTTGACSIASNAVTIPAGTYRVRIRSPFAGVNFVKTRLYDQTNSAVLLYGGSAYAPSASSSPTDAFINGRFTAAGTIAVRVEYYCSSVFATNGLGVPTSVASVNEIYCELILEKE